MQESKINGQMSPIAGLNHKINELNERLWKVEKQLKAESLYTKGLERKLEKLEEKSKDVFTKEQVMTEIRMKNIDWGRIT